MEVTMTGSFPSPSVVWQAIEIYMSRAYEGPLPQPIQVRARLEGLRQQPAEKFYECPVLERDIHVPPTSYGLRLGNRKYPHMKLAVQAASDDARFFFKADTHDRHCCPAPSSPEYKEFLALMESNEALAKQIESDWSAAGLPTFREFLRDDLARRQAAARAVGPSAV
jgi:hypothetical protein